jgi:uncharacterized protein (DUF58 family)
MRALALRLARLHPALEAYVRSREEQQWEGARNFVKAMIWLLIALVLVLNGSALRDRGYSTRPPNWSMVISGVFLSWSAFFMAVYVAVKYVPAMARTTPLRWLFFELDYQFTREGAIYSIATVVIALAALNTGNNLLFIIVASLLAGILMSGVLSRIVLTGVELKLDLPDHVFARQPVLASLTLENRKLTLPSFSLTVSGEVADGQRDKKKTKPAAVTRILREPVYFPYIPRHRHASQPVELLFPRRGRYAQKGFQVTSRFPFGFLIKTRQVEAANELVVYPPVEPTEEFYEILPLISGELESFYRGRGHDLYSIRDYQPSDSARVVDWKATAKAQALKVREFTREDERRVELVFDSCLPAGADAPEALERFERAVNFCACLAWHFYEIDSEMKFRARDRETPVAPASEIIYDVLHYLALVEPARQADGRFLQELAAETGTFKVILTAQPRGSIPTDLWTSAYFVFLDSL